MRFYAVPTGFFSRKGSGESYCPNNNEITFKIDFMSVDTTLMQERETALPGQPTTLSFKAARISFFSTSLFLVLLTLLHFINPKLEPSWHFISEYEIGETGWIMMLAFLALGISYITLYIALRPQLPRTMMARIAIATLWISATGLIIAGLFVTDPLMVAESARTTSGKIHNLGGTLGLAMPFAALLTSVAIIKNKTWAGSKRKLLGAAGLALAGFLIAMISLGAMLSASGGKFGPEVSIGWPNRFEILAYCIWLLIMARETMSIFRRGRSTAYAR